MLECRQQKNLRSHSNFSTDTKSHRNQRSLELTFHISSASAKPIVKSALSSTERVQKVVVLTLVVVVSFQGIAR